MAPPRKRAQAHTCTGPRRNPPRGPQTGRGAPRRSRTGCPARRPRGTVAAARALNGTGAFNEHRRRPWHRRHLGPRSVPRTSRRSGRCSECAETRRGRGDFAAARIGGGATRLQRREEIRGDFICWIGSAAVAGGAALTGRIRTLALDLNRDTLLGLFDLELHYACYRARHWAIRAPCRSAAGTCATARSLVLYLNEGWQPAAGGELRIFDARPEVSGIWSRSPGAWCVF